MQWLQPPVHRVPCTCPAQVLLHTVRLVHCCPRRPVAPAETNAAAVDAAYVHLICLARRHRLACRARLCFHVPFQGKTLGVRLCPKASARSDRSRSSWTVAGLHRDGFVPRSAGLLVTWVLWMERHLLSIPIMPSNIAHFPVPVSTGCAHTWFFTGCVSLAGWHSRPRPSWWCVCFHFCGCVQGLEQLAPTTKLCQVLHLSFVDWHCSLDP